MEEQSTVVSHGDVEAVVECVQDSAAVSQWRNPRRRLPAAARYSQAELLPRLVQLLVPAAQPQERELPERAPARTGVGS